MAVAKQAIVFGEQGVVRLHYIGVSDYFYIRGSVTKMEYEFGLLSRLYGLVDKRDAVDLLLAQEDGRLVFEVQSG